MKRIHQLQIDAVNAKAVMTSFLFIISIYTNINAQRVGIGTTNPLRKLAVTGSIMVDQNSNNIGTLDSAALVFGIGGQAGISSRQLGGDPQSLTFWTNGIPYMNLSSQGDLGVGGSANGSYRLWVRSGHARISGNAYVDGEMAAEGSGAFGGVVTPEYRLRVWAGDTRLGGDMHATGNVAFGTTPNPTYRLLVQNGSSFLDGPLRVTGNMSVNGMVDDNFKLRVYGGNSRFGGDVEITGDVTIGGKSSVRSNGTSPLRVSFDKKTVNVPLGANGGLTVTADIADFSGDNDDVRVSVSQIDLEPGNTMFLDNLLVHIIAVDAAANTCQIRLVNRSNAAVTLSATIYLTTIAKN